MPGGRPAKRSARNRPPSAVPLKGYGLPAEKTLRGGPVVGGTTLSRRRPVRGSPLSSSSSGPSRSQPRPRSQVQLARQRADACANDRRICVSRLRGRSRGGGLLDDPQVSATPARSFRHFLCQTPSSFTGTPPVRLVAAHLSRLATPSPARMPPRSSIECHSTCPSPTVLGPDPCRQNAGVSGSRSPGRAPRRLRFCHDELAVVE